MSSCMQVEIDSTQDIPTPMAVCDIDAGQETRREPKSCTNHRPTVLHMSCKVTRSDLNGCACVTDCARLTGVRRKASHSGEDERYAPTQPSRYRSSPPPKKANSFSASSICQTVVCYFVDPFHVVSCQGKRLDSPLVCVSSRVQW